MALLCRVVRLRHCKQMKITRTYLKLEHLASFGSKGGTSVIQKTSRANKVKAEVKFRLHKILQEKPAYRETLFVPEVMQTYQTAAVGAGYVKHNAVEEDVLKSHLSKTLANVTCFDEHSLNLCLYELDALFMNNVDMGAPVSAVLSLLDMHWFNLMDRQVIQPRHVVHTMFFIGVIRNAPATLFQHLEDYLTVHGDSLDIKEWSLVCNTFFASNRRIASIDLLRKIAESLFKDHLDCPLNLLGNFMKVFHHSGYDQYGYYMQLGDALAERSDFRRMNALTCAAHVLSLYSSVRTVHERLFDAVKQGIDNALQTSRSKQRLTKDLCRISWAFTSLQEPLPQEFLLTLEEELRFNMDHYLWSTPETVIEILTTLAVNDIYPKAILGKVFSSAFLEFKQKRLLEQDFQMQLLEMSVRLNLPGLKIKHLSKDFHGKAKESRPDVKIHLVRRTGLHPLIRGLLKCLPSPRCLSLHYVLPHSKIIDIELWFNSQGEPIEHPNGLQDETLIKLLTEPHSPSGNNLSIMHKLGLLHSAHCSQLSNIYSEASLQSSANPTNSKRLIIKVYGWNQYTRNTLRLLGLHQHEVNLLNGLGYHVIGINPADARNVEDMTDEELSQYIKSFILTKIVKF